MIGKTISHYKIVEKLGEGGMGVVYKAEDTKLKRTVALKFLTSNVLQGVAEKNRFMREAQAAASLNHPNITQIYAIEEFEDQMFIAMEYIDGHSLHEIINTHGGKLLPLKNAIDYSIQIAAGLQSAHERGVIHRDIKSANIMITSDDTVKIMDFGLAKLADRSKMTVEGSTLGTAAYMSPEQARGEEVDRRSDIWSLGVVLYEMIAGQLPFRGDYDQAVIYSIINDEPQPLTSLRGGLPLELDSIITKILEKDPAARYQHVDELPADLKKIEFAHTGSSKLSRMRSVVVKDKKSRRRAWTIGLAIGFIVGIVLTYVMLYLFYFPQQKRTSYSGQAVIHSVLDLPADAPLATVGSAPIGVGQPSLAISPDGTHLVYVAQHDGTTQLYLHPMNSLDTYPLADTEGAYFPFFSPDGNWVGFFSGIFLKKISIQGGKPVTLCEVSSARGATWDSQGNIFFPENQNMIYRVSSQGGKPQLIAEFSYYRIFPKILPGEKMLLASDRMHGIILISIDSGDQTLLIDHGSNPHYLLSGYIVYAFRGRLMAVPFDVDEMRVTGPSFPVLDGVRTEVVAGIGQYTISQDGTLVYVAGTSADKGQLVWVDRQGREKLLPFDHQFYGDLRISPDGSQAAVTVSATTDDIWIYDLFRGSHTRLTRQGNNYHPVWTPDGKQVIFSSDRNQNRIKIFSKFVTGREEPKELTEGKPYSCSPDGETLAFGVQNDIWLIDIHGDQKQEPFVSTPFMAWGPRFSPTGRYIAFTSHESGQSEVYVQPYPQTGERWQISSGGGEEPIWSPTENEIFYSNGPHWMAAAFKTKPKFEIIDRQEMFSGPYLNVPGFGYDVSPDGERFLLIKGSDVKTVDQIRIITNWFAELERLMRGEK